ncbi:UNVERIFIED_CONTAM: hypothetical protein K2H54_049758 [Gekko kuhli]
MKADAGPCKAIHSRYRFNIQTRQCELFDYGGCEGNENNFLTLEECQATCIVPDLPGKKKRARFKKEKPSFCLLEDDPGICRGMISRYFYNKESQQCEKFLYGGCLGNQNNFESLRECQDSCQNSPNSLQTEDGEKALPSTVNNSSPAVKQVVQARERNCWETTAGFHHIFLVAICLCPQMCFWELADSLWRLVNKQGGRVRAILARFP